MPEPEKQIDHEASEAIKRMEMQMRIEGKLDQAYATEGASILLMPLFLGVIFVLATLLKSIGIEGAPAVMLCVFILIGLGMLVLWRTEQQ